MKGEHRRPAEVPGNGLGDRIGPVTDVRDLLGLVLLAVGGVGMVVLELAMALGESARRPLTIVLIGGSALCLLGAGLRKANEAQWFVGLLGFALNAVGAYAFNSALFEGNIARTFLLVPALLLFSAGAVFILALDDFDFGHHGGSGDC